MAYSRHNMQPITMEEAIQMALNYKVKYECKICNKELFNPNHSTHTKSDYHKRYLESLRDNDPDNALVDNFPVKYCCIVCGKWLTKPNCPKHVKTKGHMDCFIVKWNLYIDEDRTETDNE